METVIKPNNDRTRATTLAGVSLALVAIMYFHQGGFFAGLPVEILLTIVIPGMIAMLLGYRSRQLGFQLGELKTCLVYSAVFLVILTPVVIYFASQEEFRQYYPLWGGAYDSRRTFLMYHFVIALRILCNECLFRGFLLFSIGGTAGNLVHAVVYMLAHVGKPILELPYSFILGYAIGWLNLKCKSILPGFIVHYGSNVIFDLVILYYYWPN